MLSNKVAPILVCWFKSVSGYADTVSAACKPQPAHMFWMRASDWIWLLWLLFGKYLPACHAGLRNLAKEERKRERGKRREDERLEYLVFNHNTRTLDLGNLMIHFCVRSKTISHWNQADSQRSHSSLGEFDGYFISMWTDFRLILLSNKLSLKSQKEDCGLKTVPGFKPFWVFLFFLSFQALQSCRRTWQTWPRSWIAARASPFWSTNSLSHAHSSPRWERLFFPRYLISTDTPAAIPFFSMGF